MKQSFFLATAVACLLVAGGCSKKSGSNSSATPGSVVFNYNGSTVKMAAVADTTNGYLDIVAGGLLPGSKDTAGLTLTLWYNGQTYPWIAQYSGTWTDTTNVQTAGGVLWDYTQGNEFYDVNPVTNGASLATPFTVRFSSNNGSVITGTFIGHLFQQTGNQQDSLVITNGSFNVQL